LDGRAYAEAFELLALTFAALVWFARAMFRLNRPAAVSRAATAGAPHLAHQVAQTSAGPARAAFGNDQSSGGTGRSAMFGPQAVVLWLVVLLLVMALSPWLRFRSGFAGSHRTLLTALVMLAADGFISGFVGVIALLVGYGHEPTEADRSRYPLFCRHLSQSALRKRQGDFPRQSGAVCARDLVRFHNGSNEDRLALGSLAERSLLALGYS